MVSLWLIVYILLVPYALGQDWSFAEEWVNEHDWYNEIVCGEHFNDLVATTDGTRHVSINTILVLHRPNCPPMVRKEDLPSVNHLYFVRHDLETSAKDVWYKPIPDDDLQKRYGRHMFKQKCLEALFFRKGMSLDDVPERWDRKDSLESLTEWAWNTIKVQVTLHNVYGDTLIIEQHGRTNSPVMKKEFLYDGELLPITSYPGYEIDIKLTDRTTTVYKILVGDVPKTYTIQQYGQKPDFRAAVKQLGKAAQFHNFFLDQHYLRWVQMLKQPVVIQNYTHNGYKKIKMPAEMYKYIKQYFDANYDSRFLEGITKNELLVINKNNVDTSMVHMTEAFKDEVNNYLYPILEEWCNCKIRFTVAYGIREYYKGNVLHKHVDNILTHVISALINVDQDLGGAEDWELEVIPYNGQRVQIPMQAGDIVLYESASLIHGRPRTFQGKRYANMFFHFVPVDWDFKLDGMYLVKDNHPLRESLHALKFDEATEPYRTIKTEL